MSILKDDIAEMIKDLNAVRDRLIEIKRRIIIEEREKAQTKKKD